MRISVLLLLSVLAAQPVAAAPVASVPSPPIAVWLDGQELPLDASPRIVDHRVLVPLRGIFEHLGATVDYHASTHVVTVRRAGRTVSLGVGAPLAFIHSRAVPLSVAPHRFGGRVMIPLRFVGEALGARVQWSPDTRVVRITTPTEPVVQQHLTLTARQPPPFDDARLVSEVFVTPGVVRAGDTMQVQVQGRPGSRGVMSANGSLSPLKEEYTGVYFGSAPVRPQDVVTDRRVEIRLQSPSGTETTQRTMRPVPMQGNWTPGLPVIARVETNGAQALYPGQRLVVAVEGTPGLEASFSVGDLVVPMVEHRPGLYRGEYVVQPGDTAPEASVRILLTGPTGQISAEAPSPVHLISPP